MNRYELLKKNESLIYQFVKNGILSYMMIRDIEIFNHFNELENDMSKEMKYLILSERYELSTDRIKQIIYNMDSRIK